MRSLLALSLLAFGACAAPSAPEVTKEERRDAGATVDPASVTTFDARVWVEAVRALGVGEGLMTYVYESQTSLEQEHARRARVLIDALDAAAGWRRMCSDYEPLVPDEDLGTARGNFALHPFGPDEHLVTILCDGGTYNDEEVILHVEGEKLAFLYAPGRTFSVGEVGVQYEPGPQFSAIVDLNAAARTISTLSLFSGGGGGDHIRYRVGTGANVEVEEIRMADWPSRRPESEWPVAYARE